MKDLQVQLFGPPVAIAHCAACDIDARITLLHRFRERGKGLERARHWTLSPGCTVSCGTSVRT